MLPVLIAAAAIGTGLEIYGQIKSAEDQAAAKRRDAYLKGLQGKELLERQAINEQIMLDQSDIAEKEYGSGAAASGFDTSGIGGQLKIHANTLQNIALSRRDAEFRNKMLAMGAENDITMAGNIKDAGYIRSAGTLFSGAASTGMAAQGKG